jgi:uncharacterized protein (TIGR02145 family)
MKTSIRISVSFVLLFLIYGCIKKPTPPVITTTAVTAISYTSATSGGEVTDEGGEPVVSRGLCWNISADPTIANSTTVESGGSGSFTSNITQLTPNTSYYLKAYATNSAGTGYGNQVSFTTSQVAAPVLTTSAISYITKTSAVSGGNITSDNGGTVNIRGICWSTSPNPIIATNSTVTNVTGGTGVFVSSITGLTANTTYYVRAFAVNIAGTAYGNEISFTTSPTIATLTTSAVSSITGISAIAGGDISSDGGTRVNGKGVCWSTTQNPTTNNDKVTNFTEGIGAYVSSITGLASNTTYYVKAFAINNEGTAYGNEISFKTLETVTDIDGNVYSTVIISNQTWMKENLKVIHYRNGVDIPNITDNSAWCNLTTAAYCDYGNNPNNSSTYGKLYNWHTVNSGTLCPTGWHIPTDADWTALTNNLSGESVAGGKLKETGTSHWLSPNTGATNSSGFSALPAGVRYGSSDGSFGVLGGGTAWWSSTVIDTWDSWYRSVVFDGVSVNRDAGGKPMGFSVRCIKD